MSTSCDEEDEFYRKAKLYWSKLPPTLNGVLGGYGYTSNTDIMESEKFLKRIFKINAPPNNERALDCGAGIGRITYNLLMKFFDTCDMIEQNRKFIQEAKKNQHCNRIGHFYCMGLQNFVNIKREEQYNLIWCQWVLGHLKDDDFISFFHACKNVLQPNGVIVIKENIASGDEDHFDENDCEITRTFGSYCLLFEKIGLQPLFVAKQKKFPKGLYEVQMFALRYIKNS